MKFKMGDRVIHELYGAGVVIKTPIDVRCAGIAIKFDSGYSCRHRGFYMAAPQYLKLEPFNLENK